MFAVYRPINGTSLNRNEYLLDDDGKVMVWDNMGDTINYLITIEIFYNEEIEEFMDDGSTIVYIDEDFK